MNPSKNVGRTYNLIFINFYHSTNENIVILFEYLFEKKGIAYNNEYLSVTIALKQYKNSNCCHINHDF